MTRTITIQASHLSPQAEFAVGEMQRILGARGWTMVVAKSAAKGDVIVPSVNAASDIPPEGFRLSASRAGDCSTIAVEASDEAGVMYGLMEAAEQIAVGSVEGVQPCLKTPYMPLRGVKFNIPLDVRTPSYSDVCDAAQKNIAEGGKES